jgi:hypothetical protein
LECKIYFAVAQLQFLLQIYFAVAQLECKIYFAALLLECKIYFAAANLNINVLYSIGKGYKTQTRGIPSLLKHRREASRLYKKHRREASQRNKNTDARLRKETSHYRKLIAGKTLSHYTSVIRIDLYKKPIDTVLFKSMLTELKINELINTSVL